MFIICFCFKNSQKLDLVFGMRVLVERVTAVPFQCMGKTVPAVQELKVVADKWRFSTGRGKITIRL